MMFTCNWYEPIGNRKLEIGNSFNVSANRVLEIESDSRSLFTRKRQVLLEVDFMKSRFLILAVFCALIFGVPQTGFAQKPAARQSCRPPSAWTS